MTHVSRAWRWLYTERSSAPNWLIVVGCLATVGTVVHWIGVAL